MKESYKHLMRDRVLSISFVGSLLFLVVSLVYVAISYAHLPPFIPIYNKMPWGYTRLGRTYEIFIPMGLTLIFFVMDIIFSAKMYERSPLLARLVSVVSFFLCLFSCIFIIKIITLVL